MVRKLQCVPLYLHSSSSFSKSDIGVAGALPVFTIIDRIAKDFFFPLLDCFVRIFFLKWMVSSVKGYDSF